MLSALMVAVSLIVALLALLVWTGARWRSESLQHYAEVKEGLETIALRLAPAVNYDGSVPHDQNFTVGESPIGQEEKEAEEDIGVKVPDTLTYKA